MSTTTALTIVQANLTLLQGYFVAAFPVLVPVCIGVLVLFAGIRLLKTLWHRHI